MPPDVLQLTSCRRIDLSFNPRLNSNDSVRQLSACSALTCLGLRTFHDVPPRTLHVVLDLQKRYHLRTGALLTILIRSWESMSGDDDLDAVLDDWTLPVAPGPDMPHDDSD